MLHVCMINGYYADFFFFFVAFNLSSAYSRETSSNLTNQSLNLVFMASLLYIYLSLFGVNILTRYVLFVSFAVCLFCFLLKVYDKP